MVTLPLVLLAIPSVYAGWAYMGPVLFGNYFGDSIEIAPQHAGMATLTEEWRGPWEFVVHGLTTWPFWLALSGIAVAWYLYIKRSDLPGRIAASAGGVYRLLVNNYYIDRFNDYFFAGGFRRVGSLFSDVGDRTVIDGFFVNGSAQARRRDVRGPAPDPVRIDLPIRLRHGARHRGVPVLVAHAAGHLMLPYLSLAIWVPIVAGVLVLALQRDGDAAAARWLALVGAVAGFAVTIPLVHALRARHRRDAVRRDRRVDSSLQRQLSASGSTASRCC